MSKITYLKTVLKSLGRIDSKTRLRIIESIEKIPQGDIKKLKGDNRPALYRLRMGKYRVIYHMENENIVIARVDTRGDIYK